MNTFTNYILNEVAGYYNGLLTEADTRVKRFQGLIRDKFEKLLTLDDQVSNSDYYINGNPNTTWFQYLEFNFRHHFGLMSNSDAKYLYPFALIAYSDEVGFDMRNDNGEQLKNLANVIRICKQRPEMFEKYIKNGITYSQMMDVFGPILQERDNAINAELDNTTYNGSSDYKILEDVDFTTAQEYGQYSCSDSRLCFTYDTHMWDSFTNNGINKCYLFLKNGWENIPERHDSKENSAYDTYGLSMIFVFVDPEGRISNSNTRWNHKANYPGYDVDNAFDFKTLSNVLNFDARKVLVGYTSEELKAKGLNYIPFDKVQEMLDNGADPRDVFQAVGNFCGGFASVKLNNKWNFIREDRKLLRDDLWFDSVGYFHNGLARVELGGKYNFIREDGKILKDDLWFDSVENFFNGLALVGLDDKWNFLREDGELLRDDLWFNSVENFFNGLALVELDYKYNFLRKDGQLLSPNQWFDSVGKFSGGFAKVKFDNKCNYITSDGQLLTFQQVLDRGGDPRDIFDSVGNFDDGLAMVEFNNKCNYINFKGQLLSPNQWFDDASDFYDGFATVELNNVSYYIDTNGQLYDKHTKQPVNIGSDQIISEVIRRVIRQMR